MLAFLFFGISVGAPAGLHGHLMARICADEIFGNDRHKGGGIANNSTFIVIYPATNVVETYQLNLDGNGRGILIWSNIKQKSGPMGTTQGMLLVSNCSR